MTSDDMLECVNCGTTYSKTLDGELEEPDSCINCGKSSYRVVPKSERRVL